MTNTFAKAGNDNPVELLSRVKKGIFAKSFGGGQVDIVSGKFVFSCTEAYRVENGKLGDPIKGATLIGDGPTALTKIVGIGNDMALDEGIGMCGKNGQGVPAGVGQPTLLLEGLTVGGTAASFGAQIPVMSHVEGRDDRVTLGIERCHRERPRSRTCIAVRRWVASKKLSPWNSKTGCRRVEGAGTSMPRIGGATTRVARCDEESDWQSTTNEPLSRRWMSNCAIRTGDILPAAACALRPH